MKDESNWRLFCFGDELDKSNRANEDCQVSEDMEVSSDTEASMSDICIEVPEPVELEEGEVEETSGGGEDAAVGAGAAPVVEDFDIVATKQTILKEFMLDDGSVFQLTPHKSTTGFAVADIAVLRPPIRDDAAVPPVEIYPHNVNPTIPLLLQFDQVLSSLLFSYHVNWLSGLK